MIRIISVPIEIGVPLIAKQAIRTIAGWRGLGDYKWTEKYTFSELLKMLFAGEGTSIGRPVYGDAFSFHGHKGFNWLLLEKQIHQRFRIKVKLFTPISFLGGYLNSQVWFVCKPIHN